MEVYGQSSTECKPYPQRSAHDQSLKLGRMQAAASALIMSRKASIPLEPQNRPEDKGRSFEVTIAISNRKSEDVTGISEDLPPSPANRLARAADFAKTLFLFQPPGSSLDERSLEEITPVDRENETRYYNVLSEADKSHAAAQQVRDSIMQYNITIAVLHDGMDKSVVFYL